jgi:hypothetical protein
VTTDNAKLTDSIEVAVKGPDPEVWGEEHAAAMPPTPTGPGRQVVHLEPGVKGPDPAVWGKDHAACAIPAEIDDQG